MRCGAQVRFDGSRNVVVDLTGVNMGCTGMWQGQPWSASSCNAAELFGWLAWAQQYTLNVSVSGGARLLQPPALPRHAGRFAFSHQLRAAR